MDTLQLRLFVSIASTLNFSRTAEQFFITQPAVTHHVKMLENSLGIKLLSRTNRKIKLTEEGTEFLPYANQALEIIADAENRVQNMSQGRTGHIRIAALSSTSSLISAHLQRLFKTHPTIQVDIDILEGAELINSIQTESYDFYFSINDMMSSSAYECEPIAGDRLELFVNKDIIDKIDMTDWSTIKRHPFVSIRKSDTWLSGHIKVICNNRGIVPNIVNYYNRAEAVILSVNVGIGIAILPGGLSDLYQHPNVITLPISGEDAQVTYVLAWKRSKNTKSFNIFKDIVLSNSKIDGPAL